jgi:hypothetical protein
MIHLAGKEKQIGYEIKKRNNRTDIYLAVSYEYPEGCGYRGAVCGITL